MSWVRHIAAAAIALSLAGCAGSAVTRLDDPQVDDAGGVAALGANYTSAGAATEIDPAYYRIGGLDVVDISVFQVPELTRTVQVGATGQITLPLIGTIKAAGKTAQELEVDIAAKLRVKYLQSPQVSVYVKEFNSKQITVEGAVNKPGIYPASGQLSLLKAVALAQGFGEAANEKNVVVFRNVENRRTAAKFDVKQIRAGKAPDPEIKPGDMIVVEQSGVKGTLNNVLKALPITGLFLPLL